MDTGKLETRPLTPSGPFLFDARTRLLLGAVLIAGLLALVAAYFLFPRELIPAIKEVLGGVLAWLEARPLLFFGAMCILPGLALPISPFLVAFGIVGTALWGVPKTILAAIASMIVCATWSYFLAYRFRAPFEALFLRMGVKVPRFHDENAFLFALTVRMIPGMPFFIQNYMLGFLHVPFRTFFLVTVISLSLSTPAFVLSGGAILQGNFGLLLAALGLICLVSLIMQYLRRRFVRKEAP